MGLAISANQGRFYPKFGVDALRSQRGRRWSELVEGVSHLSAGAPLVMAFTLTLRQVARTAQTNQGACRDPFCAICANKVLADFDGDENALLTLYSKNLREINLALSTMRVRELAPRVRSAAA